jgi:SAM-dependent methyltransferase
VPQLTLSPIGTEALDDPATDPALVARMLRDIARSNRWLGGVWAVRYGLAQLLGSADRGRTLKLLDIGCGGGDLAVDAVQWARRRGVTIEPIGLERIGVAARMTRDAGVPALLACAGTMPLAPSSVDLVLLSQVAHHLDPESTVRLLRDASTLARRGVVVADLRPAWFAATGFRAAGLVLGLHPTTLIDGVTSLRRGFAPEHLRALCRRAGVRDARVVARPGARLVAWWRTDAT